MSKLLLLLGLILLMTVPVGVARAQEGARGTAVISDGQALSDQITVTLQDLPSPGENLVYEGWLVSGDGQTKLSIGVFTLGPGGTVNHTYVSPTGQNLIANYGRFVITREPANDPDPANPTTDVAYQDAIPGDAMRHIRHLVVAWPEDSNKGIVTNLKEQLDLAIRHADLARNSTTLDNLRMHTHHVINIVEGTGGPNFDIAFGNPGDGIGVLAHAQTARDHAGFATQAAPGDQTIRTHADLVIAYARNASDWSVLARDQALTVLPQASIDTSRVLLSTVHGTLVAARNGNQATGEGGAEQAYIEAQRMATYVVPARAAGAAPAAGGMVGLPNVGDAAVPALARAALIVALALLGIGGVLLVRDRRSRRRA